MIDLIMRISAKERGKLKWKRAQGRCEDDLLIVLRLNDCQYQKESENTIPPYRDQRKFQSHRNALES